MPALRASAFDPDSLSERRPEVIRALLPWLRRLVRTYVRFKVDGLEHVPRGAALFVGNHNGGIAGPDVLCTLVGLWDARGVEAPLYALAHDFAMRHFTPLGRAIRPFGGLRASPANARRALLAGAGVLVYPGGDLEAYRHARRRDEIILGERTGFVRVAQETGAPIVPVVAHGAHRSGYIFHEGEGLARLLGLGRFRMVRFPLAFALPWGLALGPVVPYMPLPFPVQIRVLPPRFVARDERPDEVQRELAARMQAALDDLACPPSTNAGSRARRWTRAT